MLCMRSAAQNQAVSHITVILAFLIKIVDTWAIQAVRIEFIFHLYVHSLHIFFFRYRLGQISNNVPRKSPVGIFEEK